MSCAYTSRGGGSRPVAARAEWIRTLVTAALAAAICSCAEVTLRGPVPQAPTPLEVESETIEIDCAGDSNRLSCDLRTTTRIDNPSPKVELAHVTLESTHAHEATVWVDEVPKSRSMMGGRVVLPIAVPPGDDKLVRLQADATLRPNEGWWVASPLRTRHRWLGEDTNEITTSMRVCPAADGRWGKAASASLRVAEPRGWIVERDDDWRDEGGGVYVHDSVRSCGGRGRSWWFRWRKRQRRPIWSSLRCPRGWGCRFVLLLTWPPVCVVSYR